MRYLFLVELSDGKVSSRDAVTADGIAESVDTTGPADEPTTTLWEHLKDDVVAAFGEDAEITVRHYSNHIEVSVIPAHVEATLERNYDGVTAVPYHAFQMTIRNDD